MLTDPQIQQACNAILSLCCRQLKGLGVLHIREHSLTGQMGTWTSKSFSLPHKSKVGWFYFLGGKKATEDKKALVYL